MTIVEVVIQERRQWLREGLAQMLADHPRISVLAAVEKAQELGSTFDRLATGGQGLPSSAVMEADPTEWDPVGFAEDLRRMSPGIRVVGLLHRLSGAEDGTPDPKGFDQVVRHTAGVGAILTAVRADSDRQGGRQPGDVVRARRSGGSLLTRREMDVLGLVARGWTAREMALELEISERTVHHYRERILGKLEVQSQAHAVAEAIRRGVLEPERLLAEMVQA